MLTISIFYIAHMARSIGSVKVKISGALMAYKCKPPNLSDSIPI